MLNNSTKKIARAGIIGALYVLLSLLTLPVASGAIQFRASELLTILPLLFPEAVPALFIGCALSNLLTGCALLDVVLGSVVTLIAGILTYLCGKFLKRTALKIIIGGFFPTVLNAFILPLIWVLCYGAPEYVYIVQSAILLVSQSVVIYALGTPTYLGIKKMRDDGISFLK